MSRRTRSEYAGGGDLWRTMELLWGLGAGGSRGPKASLTIAEITSAAIAIADEEGLDAVTMRRMAERLGVGTMSLYRYVPGRAELLELMVDRVSGQVEGPRQVRGGWRTRLEHVARENARLYEQHPWLLEVFPGRPPMGPGMLDKYEKELHSFDGCSLRDVDRELILDLVLGYVRGAALTHWEASHMEERTGRTDMEWWAALEPVLDQVFTPERFPLARRVGEAASAHYGGAYDANVAFEFGLARVLDGVAAYMDGEQSDDDRKQRRRGRR